MFINAADLPPKMTTLIREIGWQLGVVVSIVGRINKVNQHGAQLVHEG